LVARLVDQGFKINILFRSTKEIAKLILLDSGKIQEERKLKELTRRVF
jgi:hypothetical protein